MHAAGVRCGGCHEPSRPGSAKTSAASAVIDVPLDGYAARAPKD